MSRKKNARTLVEALRPAQEKSGRPLGVPGWFGQPGSTRNTSQAGTTDPAAAATGALREPVAAYCDGCLRLSLGGPWLAVAAGAVLLVIVGSFFLGRRSAGLTGDAQRQPPYNPATTRNVEVAPAGGSVLVSDDAPRTKGENYLVIQGLIPSYQEAFRIKQFLNEKGIKATIHKKSAGGYYVRDLRGWRNLRDPQTAAALHQYLRELEELGKEFRRRGGRFDFRQNPQQPYLLLEN